MRIPTLLLMAYFSVSLNFGYSVMDTPEGWASQNGGTTGGIGGEEVTVSTFEELKNAAASAGKKIILVKKGKYVGGLNPQSDKSILGLEPGVVLDGPLSLSGVQNVIIRNIAVTISAKCSSYGACRSGTDAINLSGAKNVWLDHVDVSDGHDGNCDVKSGSDFITLTWCKFWYSYDKEHAFSNLIASSNGETESEGKLNITFAYNWWADRVQERQPWGRFGKIHIMNNLYTSQRAAYATGTGHKMQQLIEHNVFNCTGEGVKDKGGEHMCVANIGTNPLITCNDAGIFTPPYTLSLKMQATDVEAAVRGGAGNILTLGVSTGLPTRGPATFTLRRPYIRASSKGWTIKNPGDNATVLSILSLDGKTLFRSLRIEAGGEIEVPGKSPRLFFNR